MSKASMTMTKGTEFTEIEKGEIIGLRTAGWTFAAIEKQLGRSSTGVSKF
uniref:Tc3 transposase DNA binding domain-containing protein n=1 Tax=Globisporangium ultimum (strain ATCC 200006 / CBS 805.95 / DAOM BR144) TaxID=431595 RepID=K3XCZ8_GLOUD